jgi:hypothetical protein
MDAAVFVKLNLWHRLILNDVAIFISLADSKDGIAYHLRAKRRTGSHFGIAQMVQSDPIPASIFYYRLSELVTNEKKCFSQVKEFFALLFSRFKSYAYCTLHRQKECFMLFLFSNLKRGARFLPALKDGVSACQFR